MRAVPSAFREPEALYQLLKGTFATFLLSLPSSVLLISVLLTVLPEALSVTVAPDGNDALAVIAYSHVYDVDTGIIGISFTAAFTLADFIAVCRGPHLRRVYFTDIPFNISMVPVVPSAAAGE